MLMMMLHHIAMSAAEAAPALAHDVIPTAEEAGFKFTINLGQVVQIIGIGVPFLLYINRMSVRHALMDQNMKSLNASVKTLQDDMKTMSLALAQLPALLHTSRANHRMLQSVMGNALVRSHMVDREVSEDGEDSDNYIGEIAEKLGKMGEK